MAGRDLEVFYRLALTKQVNARNELARIAEDHTSGALRRAIRQLDHAIMATQDAQHAASVKYGFNLKAGIGPKDWEVRP